MSIIEKYSSAIKNKDPPINIKWEMPIKKSAN